MDDAFLYAAADAFRRLSDAQDASLAEHTHWSGLLDQARRLIEQQAAQDSTTFAAVNDEGRVINEGHHRAKLLDADIELIHELAAEGLSTRTIAKKFEVSPATVGRVLRGQQRSQTTMGHRLVVRAAEPVCWPASPDEFDLLVY